MNELNPLPLTIPAAAYCTIALLLLVGYLERPPPDLHGSLLTAIGVASSEDLPWSPDVPPATFAAKSDYFFF